MSQQVIAAPATSPQTGWKSWLSLENRFVPPVFITLILLVGHLSFGILESYPKTLLAIATSIAAELILGRLFFGKWPHLAAPTSLASASESLSGHQPTGPSPCAALSPSPRSMCCASRIATSGIPRTLASLLSSFWPATMSPVSAFSGETFSHPCLSSGLWARQSSGASAVSTSPEPTSL